jgi:hypothetical protein
MDFVAELAGKAERAWNLDSIEWQPPIVDPDILLEKMSGTKLDDTTRVRIGDSSALELCPSADSADSRGLAESIVRTLVGQSGASIGDLLRSVSALSPEDDLTMEERLGSEPGRLFQRQLIELIAYGVVEVQ